MNHNETVPETELINSDSKNLDQLSTLEFVTLMNQEDLKAVGAVQAVLPAVTAVIDGIAERMREGGRLIYLGAGTSGWVYWMPQRYLPPLTLTTDR